MTPGSESIEALARRFQPRLHVLMGSAVAAISAISRIAACGFAITCTALSRFPKR
jgi:hypothetical protein